MEKRTFRENSVIFESTADKAIDHADMDQGSRIQRTTPSRPPVATPNQIPDPVKLGHLPESVLKTGAVNSLIQQNEDLISRLSIAIRRYSKIEEQLDGKDERISQLEADQSHYKDQCMLFEKKIELMEERTKDVFSSREALENELHLLETRYAELYSNKQEKVERALKQKNHYQGKAERLARYRSRIKVLAEKVREEIALARHHAHKIERDYLSLNQDFQGMKERLSATVTRVQDQAKSHQTEIAEITDSYEEKLSELQRQYDERMVEFEGLQSRNRSLENIQEKCVEFENRVIFAERKLSDLKEDHSQQVDDLQSQITKYRTEAKERTVEIQNVKDENIELAENNNILLTENQKLTDQIESLQVVWNNSHTQLENEKEKNNSLQKLNQQISLTLNEARQENRKLREDMEARDFRTKKLVSELEAQIQALGKRNQKQQVEVQPEVVEKIESLIAEAQSGALGGS